MAIALSETTSRHRRYSSQNSPVVFHHKSCASSIPRELAVPPRNTSYRASPFTPSSNLFPLTATIGSDHLVTRPGRVMLRRAMSRSIAAAGKPPAVFHPHLNEESLQGREHFPKLSRSNKRTEFHHRDVAEGLSAASSPPVFTSAVAISTTFHQLRPYLSPPLPSAATTSTVLVAVEMDDYSRCRDGGRDASRRFLPSKPQLLVWLGYVALDLEPSLKASAVVATRGNDGCCMMIQMNIKLEATTLDSTSNPPSRIPHHHQHNDCHPPTPRRLPRQRRHPAPRRNRPPHQIPPHGTHPNPPPALRPRRLPLPQGPSPRSAVLSCRQAYFDFLSPSGVLKPNTDPVDGVFDADNDGADFPSIGAGPDLGDRLGPGSFAKLAEKAHTEGFYLDFARHPALKEFVAELKGWKGEDTLLLPRSLLRNNTPRNKAIGVHYDQSFLRHGEPTSVTAWVPIGDIGLQGGGLIYLEGSKSPYPLDAGR